MRVRQPDAAAEASFLAILKVAPNTEFSSVRVRDSLQALFDTQRVANARVEVIESGTKTGPIRLRFVIQRQVQISEVNLEVAPTTGVPISSDELRARLSLVQPGSRLSKQIIVRNADEIQVYLRDRGYFNATVEPRNKSTLQARAQLSLIALPRANRRELSRSISASPGSTPHQFGQV